MGKAEIRSYGDYMEQRISIITLGVSDLKKSRNFYDSLGWKAATERQTEEIVTYNLPHMGFALYQIDKLSDDATVRVKLNSYSSFSMAYNVDSEEKVNETINNIETIGGKIIKQPQKVFWGGYSGYFADLDGYLWEVAYNPFSVLGKNNEFQWSGDNNE